MSIATKLRAASIEANGILAQVGGAASGAANLIGPDGRRYTGVFRSASAFEVAAAGSEMETHGYKDGEVMILTIPQAQFAFIPRNWRRQNLTRISPAQNCRVASITITDSLLYGFVLFYRQGPAA
jgi:hypothetical protein